MLSRFPRPWPEHTVGAQKMTSEEREPTTGASAASPVKPGTASPAGAQRLETPMTVLPATVPGTQWAFNP